MTQVVNTIVLTDEVLAVLEPQLRYNDVNECRAMGLSSIEALRQSRDRSVEAYLVEIDGEVVAFWGYGVSSPLGECCYPWLLTTVAVEKHKYRFARGSIRVVEYLLSRYPRLSTMVDCRYHDAIGWLEWLGFNAHQSAVPVGSDKVPFLVMSIQNEVLRERAAWVH